MAIAPLFIADTDTLKAQVRLSGSVQPDALAIIDASIQEVRVGFYDALEVTRVDQLKALSYADNPATSDEILRAKANATEVKWVRMLLLRRLPSLFMDSSGQSQQNWNEDGLPRGTDENYIESEIDRLKKEILDALDDLKGGIVDTSELQVDTIGPEETPPLPGASIFS